jgi:hypothetical protein
MRNVENHILRLELRSIQDAHLLIHNERQMAITDFVSHSLHRDSKVRLVLSFGIMSACVCMCP